VATIWPVAGLLITTLLALTPVAASAATTGTVIVVKTDHEIQGAGGYDGYGVVQISGTVTPPPPAGTTVIVTTTNPQGTVVESAVEPLLSSSVGYTDTLVVGCTPVWIGGTYTITVSLSGSPEVAPVSTQFGYIPNPPEMDMVSVNVTPQSVSGPGTVIISGTVAACSESIAGTTVLLSVNNPSGTTVYRGLETPTSKSSIDYGNYSVTLNVGGATEWIPGNYTAAVNYRSVQSSGTPASAIATFIYTGNSTQSPSILTTSQTSSSSASAQATSSSASAAINSPVSSTTQSGGAPLIPYVAAIAIAAGVAATFVGFRVRRKSPQP
jgi:hypothetical protein